MLFKYSRSESNRDQRNRNPLFYPLNYGSSYWEGKDTKTSFYPKTEVMKITTMATGTT